MIEKLNANSGLGIFKVPQEKRDTDSNEKLKEDPFKKSK